LIANVGPVTFLAVRLTIRHWRGGLAEQFASMHCTR